MGLSDEYAVLAIQVLAPDIVIVGDGPATGWIGKVVGIEKMAERYAGQVHAVRSNLKCGSAGEHFSAATNDG